MSLFRPWLGPESLNPDNLSAAYQQQHKSTLANQKSFLSKLASLQSPNSANLDGDHSFQNSRTEYDCNNTPTSSAAIATTSRNHSNNSATSATMKPNKEQQQQQSATNSDCGKQNYYSYYYNYYYSQLVYYASLQNQTNQSHNSVSGSTNCMLSSSASINYRSTSLFSSAVSTSSPTSAASIAVNMPDLYQSVTPHSSTSSAASSASSSNSTISEDDNDADDYNQCTTATTTTSDNTKPALSTKFQLSPNQHKQHHRSHEPSLPLSSEQRPTPATSNQFNGDVPNFSKVNLVDSKQNMLRSSKLLCPDQIPGNGTVSLLGSSAINLQSKKVSSPIVDIQNILAFQNLFLDNLNYGKKRVNKSTAEQRPKKFICHECKSGFSNRSQLNSHIRTHTGERPFVCDFKNCHKSFTRNEELTRHRRIHSGIRPYPCKWCDKRFGRKDHLRKHERTHERRLRSTILLNYSSNLPAAIQSHFAPSSGASSHGHHHHHHHSNPSDQLAKLEASQSALSLFSNKSFVNPFVRPEVALSRPVRSGLENCQSSLSQSVIQVPPLPSPVELYQNAPPVDSQYRNQSAQQQTAQSQLHRLPTHHKSFVASSAVSI